MNIKVKKKQFDLLVSLVQDRIESKQVQLACFGLSMKKTKKYLDKLYSLKEALYEANKAR
jgi:hypothetical protein